MSTTQLLFKLFYNIILFLIITVARCIQVYTVKTFKVLIIHYSILVGDPSLRAVTVL